MSFPCPTAGVDFIVVVVYNILIDILSSHMVIYVGILVVSILMYDLRLYRQKYVFA